MTRFVVLFVMVIVGVVALPEDATACSCAGGRDPRQMLEEADAAFVGTLIARHVERRDPRVGSSGDPTTLVFRTELAAKGDFGELVSVETVSSGVSCGIEAPIGTRMGLFLTRTGGGWWSGLCQRIDPALLIEAAGLKAGPRERGASADTRLLHSALETLLSFLQPLCALRLLPLLSGQGDGAKPAGSA